MYSLQSFNVIDPIPSTNKAYSVIQPNFNPFLAILYPQNISCSIFLPYCYLGTSPEGGNY